jgi:chaperonin GroEL
MYKKIIHKTDMRKNIKRGMDLIASIVATTLGPGGLPVQIERVGQSPNGEPLGPMITKDGVTVASECADADQNIDVVIQTVKAICQKTNRVVGDGTTTAIVLGRAILEEALKLIETEGLNPQLVRREIELAAKHVDELLEEEIIPCDSYSMMGYVATISANGDEEIGQIIQNAFEAVGSEGAITVDTGFGKYHSLNVVNGFQIRRGAEAQDRFLNNADKTKFEAENCHVILYDGKLNSPQQVLQTMELIYKQTQGKMPPVLFVANEFSLDVIQALLINKAHAGLSICAVRSPHQTKVTTQWLDDMAVFMGGTRIGNGNKNLNNLEWDDIGIVKKVVVDKYTTTFYDGFGEDEGVLQRIDQLKAQRETAESDYDSAIISDRIAALSEGIAKIGVGGLTDLEVKEKYHRIEDAINAARAAIEEGVVPGGGATLLRISELLPDNTTGYRILKTALKAPFKQILENLGKTDEEINSVINQIYANVTQVFDGNTNSFVDALEAGVIDPVKVTKTALSNAVSICSLLSTSGGAIVINRKS